MRERRPAQYAPPASAANAARWTAMFMAESTAWIRSRVNAIESEVMAWCPIGA